MSWLDLVFPPCCTVCGCAGTALCPPCAARLRSAPGPLHVPGFDGAAALLDYRGAGRDLVRGLKFGNRRALVPALGEAMAALPVPDCPLITWIPSSLARRRRDGADQAARLARALAAARRRRARRLLARKGRTTQTGSDRPSRLAGPDLVVRGPVAGAVLVVDDVVTTGSTLRAAAAALRSAGGGPVFALVLARTPLKVEAGSAE